MGKTRRIQPIWTVQNDGSRYTESTLQATARKLAEEMKETHEEIQSIDRPVMNGKIPDEVNGRMVDPVAERVYICSALVMLESIDEPLPYE